MKCLKYRLLVLISFFFLVAVHMHGQQTDSLAKQDKGKLFVNLYPGFYFRFDDARPKSGFVMTTALLGYKRQISEKVNGTIIFDVTRTTNNIQVKDSAGNLLNVSYFEGSKYTAFLKMAEINWQLNDKLGLSVGQLLNTQYLTYQDKFWAHRYVEVTFQELNRFGNPADFGMRLKYQPVENLAIYAGAFNGEGPFRHQDENADFLFCGNIEYQPVKSLMLKFYYGNQSNSSADSLEAKNVYSAFVGFKQTDFSIGLEYDYVQHADFYKDNWSGLSAFAFYQLNKQLEIFYRFDYIEKSKAYENVAYHIAGLQYKVNDALLVSGNYRYLSSEKANMFYLNFGLKF